MKDKIINKQKTVFLIAGKKRSGKNFVAEILSDLLQKRKKRTFMTHFADPMKRILATSFGISIDKLNEYKNFDDNFDINIAESYDSCCIHHGTSMREILQRFGTEAMKPEFGEDVWSNLCEKNVSNQKNPYVIIPDFRFLTEYEVFKTPNIWGFTNKKDKEVISKYKVVTILVNNPEQKIENDIQPNIQDNHSSENSLNDFDFDYIIENLKGNTQAEIKEKKLLLKGLLRNILLELS